MVASEICKLAISNEGEVIQKNIDVNARKIPLRGIRKEALTRNKSFLKIKDDDYYTQLNREEIISEFQKIHEEVSDNLEEMRSSLKKYQRQRHWLLWHDHSTLANYGHMLFVFEYSMTDPAIHFTRQEMIDKTSKDIDIQATIEKLQSPDPA